MSKNKQKESEGTSRAGRNRRQKPKADQNQKADGQTKLEGQAKLEKQNKGRLS